MDAFADRYPFTALVIILALSIGAGVVAFVFARLLLRNISEAAGAEQPMTTMMLILGTLSVVALVGGLLTQQESAYTIAATGAGAFAGALTARSQAAYAATPPEPPPDPVEAPYEPPEPFYDPTSIDPDSEEGA